MNIATSTDDTRGKARVERRHRRLIAAPALLRRFEQRLGSTIPLHPNALSALKLFVVAPALLLSLRQVRALPGGALLITLLFLAFGLLDYLDGVVARERGLASQFGRIFDRVTDYPLLLTVSYFCLDLVDNRLLAAKLALDGLLFALYLWGRGSTQNRLRTLFSYSALLSLLALSQGWLAPPFGTHLVNYLLGANIVLSGIVALYNLDVLKKRYIADGLSFANLCCGLLAMHATSHGHFVTGLILLLVGVSFDGVDGAAARRWGSTRWGVYSDDVADGVNFGIAPGVAVYFAVGGLEGAIVGGTYAFFTIARLVYFTINKDDADPAYFNGVPSTVGGAITLSAVVLFRDSPVMVGMFVGLACALMVSFRAHYRHLGRMLAARPRLLLSGGVAMVLAVGAGLWLGSAVPVATLLVVCVGYSLIPIARAFVQPRPAAAAG